MKIRLGILPATFLSASFVAAPAGAQDTGVYLGAALGQAEHRDACEEANISCDEKDTAWRVFGGYQFNRHIAVELGYADLGESSAAGVIGGATARANFEVTAWDLTAVGSFPVIDRLSLFGRFGLYRAEAELSGTVTIGAVTVPVNIDDSNTDITFGVGARYDITRNLGVRGEWQRYKKVGGDDTGESDIDVLAIGLLYRF